MDVIAEYVRRDAEIRAALPERLQSAEEEQLK